MFKMLDQVMNGYLCWMLSDGVYLKIKKGRFMKHQLIYGHNKSAVPLQVLVALLLFFDTSRI